MKFLNRQSNMLCWFSWWKYVRDDLISTNLSDKIFDSIMNITFKLVIRDIYSLYIPDSNSFDNDYGD